LVRSSAVIDTDDVATAMAGDPAAPDHAAPA